MDGGGVHDQDRGFYSTRLNSVSSQCALGKPSVVRKPENHPKIFKWYFLVKKCNPPDFKFYPSKLNNKIVPHMV